MDLDCALREYRDAMLASLSVKDNNKFWPRGIPALSYPSAHLVLASLLDQIAVGIPPRKGLHPTSVLCLLLYLTHGIRRVTPPVRQRVRLTGELLRHVIASRSGSLRPSGPMLIHRWRDLPGATGAAAGVMRSEQDYVADCFRLGGQAFALGETAFFFAHRLLTERHGPYQVANDLFVSCRHVRNLSACRIVWPEAAHPDAPDADLAIWTFFDQDRAGTFSYDMWGNPVFLIDPMRDCLGAAAYARTPDADCALLSAAEVAAWRARLTRQARDILEVVDHASENRLAIAARSIMLAVTHLELGIELCSETVNAALVPPYDFRISGPADWLADYYDWRASWPPAPE